MADGRRQMADPTHLPEYSSQDLTLRRPWFQLHLSTCIVLMLAAGVLVGLNLMENGRSDYFEGSDWAVFPRTRICFGWPFTSFIRLEWPSLERLDDFSEPVVTLDYGGIAKNALLDLTAFTSCAFIFERTIRRREKLFLASQVDET